MYTATATDDRSNPAEEIGKLLAQHTEGLPSDTADQFMRQVFSEFSKHSTHHSDLGYLLTYGMDLAEAKVQELREAFTKRLAKITGRHKKRRVK